MHCVYMYTSMHACISFYGWGIVPEELDVCNATLYVLQKEDDYSVGDYAPSTCCSKQVQYLSSYNYITAK